MNETIDDGDEIENDGRVNYRRTPSWRSDCGTVHLYCGDCLEVLPTLEAGSVDAVVTDPPYLISAGGGGIGGKRKYLADIRGRIDCGFNDEILKPFNNWLVFCSKAQIVDLISLSEQMSLRWQLLTWNKTNPTPLCNGNYLPDTEYMIHAFKRHDFESKTRFIVGSVEKNVFDHPTVKPMYVMAKAVASATTKGDCVLDPFMGSGTTGVACIRTGRRFIGIELNERYFEIAKRRIMAELNRFPLLDGQPQAEQGRLFGDDNS